MGMIFFQIDFFHKYRSGCTGQFAAVVIRIFLQEKVHVLVEHLNDFKVDGLQSDSRKRNEYLIVARDDDPLADELYLWFGAGETYRPDIFGMQRITVGTAYPGMDSQIRLTILDSVTRIKVNDVIRDFIIQGRGSFQAEQTFQILVRIDILRHIDTDYRWFTVTGFDIQHREIIQTGDGDLGAVGCFNVFTEF